MEATVAQQDEMAIQPQLMAGLMPAGEAEGGWKTGSGSYPVPPSKTCQRSLQGSCDIAAKLACN